MTYPELPPLSSLAEELFDLVSDTIFFVKDAGGRYVSVNQSLVERCNRARKSEIIGKTVAELYPASLAEGYAAQDRYVLRTGRSITGKLELHLYPDGRRGWCLTSKIPVRRGGRIVGLAGISHDVGAPGDGSVIPPLLAAAVEHLHEHFDRPLTIAELASKAGLRPARFVRLVKRIFRMTPGQLLIQVRIQEATERLRTTRQSVAQIAMACGFGDQSAFTRRFKVVTGFTPLRYRGLSGI